MATTSQPSPAPHAPALDNLQAMVDLVLVQSGRFLREQHTGGGSGRAQHSMKRAVPAALERFQDSLDELEGELHQAQAVLRRDLALLQADRRKREHAEAAERQRLAAESSARKNAVAAKPDEPAPSSSSAAAAKPDEAMGARDETAELLASQSKTSERPHEAPPPISTTTAPPHDPLFDGTPTTANAQDTDFDFDAMFGEGADNTDNQADVNLDSPLDESGPSLLRGLADFAKDGDGPNGDTSAAQESPNMDMDFAMPDLPDLSANDPPEKPTTPKAEDASTAQQPTDNDDNANMLDPIGTDDLDDLFNLDYDNAESSEFDNAFFGFGES